MVPNRPAVFLVSHGGETPRRCSLSGHYYCWRAAARCYAAVSYVAILIGWPKPIRVGQ
jgi:hypothetical protein